MEAASVRRLFMGDEQDRLMALFNEARGKHSAAEREAYLSAACGGDATLRRQVEGLLQAYEQAGDFLKPPVDDLPEGEGSGTVIGRYKLCEKLGEGGFGVVYVAQQEEPVRRRVALKIIKLGMDTRAVIARFEAERQALALMDHPNIAKVLEAGAMETGRPYFVMELVRGVRITEYCDQHCLSTNERLKLFMQVCHALQHAHQKGIIHRDLKPSNILVTVQDELPVPKVIDFGIAKATGGQLLTDKTLYTAMDQFLGTPAYSSPEQAQAGGVDIDTRSDIYNLGVLLYELLTGHTPFDQKELVAAGLDEMRRIIRETEPARPSTRLSTLAGDEQTTVANRRHSDPPQLLHQLRGDLDWIVMKSLEKERNQRYETANGLADDISRHLNNEPVAARPPSRAYRFQKLVRRNKLVFAAAAAVTAALVIGLGLATWLLFREQAAHRQAVAAQRQAQAQAKKSEQVALFLEDMLQGVGPSVSIGRDTTMLKEILDKTAQRVGRDLKDQPETEAELRRTIGNVYFALAQYTNAEAMHRAALTIQRTLWGNLNTNVARSLNGLAWDLMQQGAVERAEPLFLESWNIVTNLLGTEHPLVGSCLQNLGEVRYVQSRFPEAERFARQSLAMRRKLLGNECIEVASSLTLLSCALIGQRHLAEGESGLREALAIQTRVFAAEPLWDIWLTRLHLGDVLYLQHKFDEAEIVLRRALNSYPKVVGAEHWHVVRVLLSLSAVLVEEGKTDEAQILAREALGTSKKIVGRPSLRLRCLGTLLSALCKGGKMAETMTLRQEILETARQLPPSCGLVVALAKSGDLLRDHGELAEAEALYREGLKVWSNVLTNDYELREWVIAGLSDVLRDQGKLAEAEPLYREGLDLCRKFSPETCERRQWLAGGLARTLRSKGQLAEAEPLYREALTNAVRLWPNDPARWQWMVHDLADVLASQGKASEAEKVAAEFLRPAAQARPADAAPQEFNRR